MDNINIEKLREYIKSDSDSTYALYGFDAELSSCLHELLDSMDIKYLDLNTDDLYDLSSSLEESKVDHILMLKNSYRICYDATWLTSCVKSIICLDSDNILCEEDKKNSLMNKRLWDVTAMNAKDDIEIGGWMSSYTREKFTMNEINDFINNTKAKLLPYLKEENTVLEIGCASGFTMYSLSPYVRRYVGVDMSAVSVKKNLKKIEEENIKGVEVKCMAADEISEFEDESFDVIILNSVIHCFKGYNYFYKVLKEIFKKVKKNGIVYIGDVMDLELKEQFENSLVEYAKENNYNTKVDISNEFLLSAKFFECLKNELPIIQDILISRKECEVKNELTMYRFDTLIKMNKCSDSFDGAFKMNAFSCNIFNK